MIGTALDVWQIVDSYRDFGSVEAMAAEGNLSERQVRLAMAYHERFPEEIDEAIALNRRPLEAGFDGVRYHAPVPLPGAAHTVTFRGDADGRSGEHT